MDKLLDMNCLGEIRHRVIDFIFDLHVMSRRKKVKI